MSILQNFETGSTGFYFNSELIFKSIICLIPWLHSKWNFEFFVVFGLLLSWCWQQEENCTESVVWSGICFTSNGSSSSWNSIQSTKPKQRIGFLSYFLLLYAATTAAAIIAIAHKNHHILQIFILLKFRQTYGHTDDSQADVEEQRRRTLCPRPIIRYRTYEGCW